MTTTTKLNLTEQVLKNTNDIALYMKRADLFSALNLEIAGVVASENDLTYPTREGEVWLVGAQPPYEYYIATSNEYINTGTFQIPGVEGPTGPTGPSGASTKWTAITSVDYFPSSPNIGDFCLITTTGEVYEYTTAGWLPKGTIKGPQGPQGATGPTGPQGPRGATGAQGPQGDPGAFIHIEDIVSIDGELPDPEEINDLTAAYLVGTSTPYDLYIQVGETPLVAVWVNMGVLNIATYITVGGQFVNTWNADTKLDALIYNAERSWIKGTGEGSAIENSSCQASGDYAIAGGYNTKANALASVALGRSCNASAENQFVMGQNTYGYSTAPNSFIFGRGSDAGGAYSFIGGYANSIVNGQHNTTLGRNNIIRSGVEDICAFGSNLLVTNGTRKTVLGRYNSSNENALLEIGDGSSESVRYNAFEVSIDPGTLKYQIKLGDVTINEDQLTALLALLNN